MWGGFPPSVLQSTLENDSKEGVMPNPNPTQPFFLIVADLDTGLFCVEGPMTDDGPWNLAAGRA